MGHGPEDAGEAARRVEAVPKSSAGNNRLRLLDLSANKLGLEGGGECELPGGLLERQGLGLSLNVSGQGEGHGWTQGLNAVVSQHSIARSVESSGMNLAGLRSDYPMYVISRAKLLELDEHAPLPSKSLQSLILRKSQYI
jgi:hypothetical protein